MKKVKKITVPVVQFDEFREKMLTALDEWLADERKQTAFYVLNHGIPSLNNDNLEPFINWSFLILQPDLPTQYFVQTDEGFWLISLGDCICWGTKENS